MSLSQNVETLNAEKLTPSNDSPKDDESEGFSPNSDAEKDNEMKISKALLGDFYAEVLDHRVLISNFGDDESSLLRKLTLLESRQLECPKVTLLDLKDL